MTAIEKELTEKLKNAMRAKDKVALAALRMVRTKIMEKRTAKGAGELTEEMVLTVIRSYVKSLQSALDEFIALGTAEDDTNVVQLKAEIALLDEYMPKYLSETDTSALVEQILSDNGINDIKMTGRAMGLIMKTHKGQVDPGLVNRLIRSRLAG